MTPKERSEVMRDRLMSDEEKVYRYIRELYGRSSKPVAIFRIFDGVVTVAAIFYVLFYLALWMS
jgi:hypothetical protein